MWIEFCYKNFSLCNVKTAIICKRVRKFHNKKFLLSFGTKSVQIHPTLKNKNVSSNIDSMPHKKEMSRTESESLTL